MNSFSNYIWGPGSSAGAGTPQARATSTGAQKRPIQQAGMGRLNERVAVITGGTRGIGYAITRAYALEGARVVLCSRHPESVSRAVSNLRSEGLQASGIPADGGSRLGLRDLMAHALQEFGRLDIWFNNAALSAPYGPSWLVDEETFE